MGLDMYVFRIPKLSKEDRAKIECNRAANLQRFSFVPVEDVSSDEEEAVPSNAEKVEIYIHVLNEEHLVQHLGFDPQKCDVSFGWIGGEEFGVRVIDKETQKTIGEKEMPKDEVLQFYELKLVNCYVWKAEQVFYWRKDYELDETIQEIIGPVDNCAFRKIPLGDIEAINYAMDEICYDCDERIPYEDDLYYHIWY